MHQYVVIDREDVSRLINTLTQIDVRGFPSMDRLVASVSFLENTLKQGQAGAAAVSDDEKGAAE